VRGRVLSLTVIGTLPAIVFSSTSHIGFESWAGMKAGIKGTVISNTREDTLYKVITTKSPADMGYCFGGARIVMFGRMVVPWL